MLGVITEELAFDMHVCKLLADHNSVRFNHRYGFWHEVAFKKKALNELFKRDRECVIEVGFIPTDRHTCEGTSDAPACIAGALEYFRNYVVNATRNRYQSKVEFGSTKLTLF
jgi:hypothetical protein